MRYLRTKGDPCLKMKCHDVTDFGDDLYRLVKDMRQIMQTNKGCGLAAPQVGSDLNVIIVQKQKSKGTYAIVNPVIVKKSEYTNVLSEGCLSYPGVSKQIERPNSILVYGKSVDGREISIEATDIEARIFCHEIDHLNGRCKVGE